LKNETTREIGKKPKGRLPMIARRDLTSCSVQDDVNGRSGIGAAMMELPRIAELWAELSASFRHCGGTSCRFTGTCPLVLCSGVMAGRKDIRVHVPVDMYVLPRYYMKFN
jgi:hypothetical protein